MFSRIETIEARKLAGKQISMSLINNQTGSLWGSFMPFRSQIRERIGTALYSLQVYPANYFSNFDPATTFTKWALTEVGSLENLPEGIEPFMLPAGTYAVFIHKGDTSSFPNTLQFIFTNWLPGSGYHLDNRPHFEILGDRYKNNDPDSEEEVWIPIKEL